MDAAAFLADWQANRHRPSWVQANRARLHDLTGDRPPPDTRGCRDWVRRYGHVVTKVLRAEVAGDEAED